VLDSRWRPAPARHARVLLAAEQALGDAYGLHEIHRIDGELDPVRLRDALSWLVDDHPLLRASFAIDSSGVRWRLGDIPRVQATPDPDLVAAAWRDCRRDGAYFSVRVAQNLLHVFAHHALLDGPGLETAVRGLADRYAALAGGSVPTVAATPVVLPVNENREDWTPYLPAGEPAFTRRPVGAQPYAAYQSPTPAAADFATAASQLGVTTFACWVAILRTAVPAATGRTLRRITAQLAPGRGADPALDVDPLPLIGDPMGLPEAAEIEADRIYRALELGPPPADLIGPLTTTITPGLPDCLVGVSPAAPPIVFDGRPTTRMPAPVTGAAAVLVAELSPDGVRMASDASIFDADDLAAIAVTTHKLAISRK
jgi:hypothetical protein